MTLLRSWPGIERREPSLLSPHFLHLFELARALRTVISQRAAFPRARVLDVACARKPYFPFFAHLQPNYIGLDRSPKPAGPDCLGAAERLPFKDDSFDVVLCTQAIGYFDDPAEAMVEMGRVLRPGGHLILSSPGLYPYMLDRWRFTHEGMRSLLEEAGLGQVHVYANGGAAMCLAQLFALNLSSLVEARHGLADRLLASLSVALINAVGFGVDRLTGGRGATYCCMNYVVTGTKPDRGVARGASGR